MPLFSINKDALSNNDDTSKKPKEDLSWKSESEDHDAEELGSSSDGTGESHHKEEEKAVIANEETAAVFRLRLIVFFVLLISSAAVSVTVFFISHQSIESEYESSYQGASDRVLESFRNIAASKLGAISSLGVAMLSHGVDHFRDWPFNTLSSFQQRSATVLSQSQCLFLKFAPQVTEDEREAWENFTVGEDSYWIEESIEYQRESGLFDVFEDADIPVYDTPNARKDIWRLDEDGDEIVDPGPGPYFPVWQSAPLLEGGAITNENVLAVEGTEGATLAYDNDQVVISEFVTAPPGSAVHDNILTSFFAKTLTIQNERTTDYRGDPVSRVFFPIYDSFEEDRKSVAIMVAWLQWSAYFEAILPDTVSGIVLVLDDSCGHVYTLKISVGTVEFLGDGDRHDTGFDSTKRTETFQGVANIEDGTRFGLPLNLEHCPTSLSVYSSQEFEDSLSDRFTPILMTIAVAVVFIFTGFIFVIYDRLVERRQALVLRQATQSTAIVSSLFPEAVRDRLMRINDSDNRGSVSGGNSNLLAPKNRLKGYLNGAQQQTEEDDQPIADLFPHCTVLFGDIAGFTAWSSTREPAQVFVLLQMLYQAFDEIAKRRRVFKVETIGDSYVAVTGLPEPQKQHPVIMARFAYDCLAKMRVVTAELQRSLGPDTTDLAMRVGMHSGPVTAGVLRGERARFQLFGDTVNTAARMESTGSKDRVQISEETCVLLKEMGKGHWVTARSDLVEAKGKGTMQTYWVNPAARASTSNTNSTSSGGGSDHVGEFMDSRNGHSVVVKQEDPAKLLKRDRLVDWMVDVLSEQVKKIVSMNMGLPSTYNPNDSPAIPSLNQEDGRRSLDEVAEIIHLPRFDPAAFAKAEAYKSVSLTSEVTDQLRQYVSIIASMYRDNPFHNFEHACHVTMATVKFLKRVAEPKAELESSDDPDLASKMHQYTHGINSDPLTVLAILLSALIHDTDHRGVSNMQMGQEEPKMADYYHHKSVAEQNSLDISWELLMSSHFVDLQCCLFRSGSDLKRFRQVLVNVVLATDIFDKELNDQRKARWAKAFNTQEGVVEGPAADACNDLRGTIVIEHIIQASDVAHTMQHWHVYRKWNTGLFQEMYVAWKNGRMAKDPSLFWYHGELGFFDNYVIPLAKKLESCNVFGVSSDECLNYATRNRAEWEHRGAELVAEMVEEIQAGMDLGEKENKVSEEVEGLWVPWGGQ